MKYSIITILVVFISVFVIEKSEAQIKKKNHIIVLIDNSGEMDVPGRGGFSRNQLEDLIKNKLPEILFDKHNDLKPGSKLLDDEDYLTLYFCGVNNQTQPTTYNYFTKKIGFEFTPTNRGEFQNKVNNLDLNALFNKDFAGMTMARQLAINRLGEINNKPNDIGNTYFLVLTDDQLNSKDITTELEQSPFVPSYRPRVRNAYERAVYDYNIPISKSKLISTVNMYNGRDKKGWSILEIIPRVMLADFNVRSLLLNQNSNVELLRTDNWNYKGKYKVDINPLKENKYKIKNVNWTLFDKNNNKALKKGIITDPDKSFAIDIELKNPKRLKDNYQLRLTYDILLNDVYGCTVVSPKTSAFDETDNLSMAVNINPEKTEKIFGFYELPASMFIPAWGDQQSNVIAWNLIFSIIAVLIVIGILRMVYIQQLNKKTPWVKATIT